MRGNVLVSEQCGNVEFQLAVKMIFLNIVADMIACVDEMFHFEEQTQTKSE
jgi:hypothetical protein